MKITSNILVTSVLCLFLFGSCTEEKHVAEEIDILNDTFPEAQEEIKETLNNIGQSVLDGDLDKLISYHAYTSKFTEFKDGQPRNNGEENEVFERQVFGSVTEILKFNMDDLKIAVYGDVANVTTHTDFHLKFGEDEAVIKDQMTLLFVKTDGGWKIVHEHHSPLSM